MFIDDYTYLWRLKGLQKTTTLCSFVSGLKIKLRESHMSPFFSEWIEVIVKSAAEQYLYRAYCCQDLELPYTSIIPASSLFAMGKCLCYSRKNKELSKPTVFASLEKTEGGQNEPGAFCETTKTNCNIWKTWLVKESSSLISSHLKTKVVVKQALFHVALLPCKLQKPG